MGGLGLEVTAQVAAGALLGWLFDRWQDTDPTGLLIGSVIGIGVGLLSLVRGALKLNRLLDQQHPTAGRTYLPPDPDDDDHDEQTEP